MVGDKGYNRYKYQKKEKSIYVSHHSKKFVWTVTQRQNLLFKYFVSSEIGPTKLLY